jgi:Cof subfamily protein (haloacid dehalogenase superfamily)
MIKLLALDIDGTILKKDYTLSDKVKDAIQNAAKKGVNVVLVTGRMHKATTFIAKELGLKTPVITYNGALAKSEKEVFLEQKIHTELVQRVVTEAKNFEVQINLYLDDILYSEAKTPEIIEYCEKRKIEYTIKAFDEIENLTANKLLVIGKNPDDTTQIIEYLSKTFENELNIVRSMPTFCEVLNKDASKGNAILHLAQHWGITPYEIMAAGDQDNDIDMLKIANIKVAMGNATEGLKKVANYIAPPVDEDGLAVAIEEMILGEKNV